MHKLSSDKRHIKPYIHTIYIHTIYIHTYIPYTYIPYTYIPYTYIHTYHIHTYHIRAYHICTHIILYVIHTIYVHTSNTSNMNIIIRGIVSTTTKDVEYINKMLYLHGQLGLLASLTKEKRCPMRSFGGSSSEAESRPKNDRDECHLINKNVIIEDRNYCTLCFLTLYTCYY